MPYFYNTNNLEHVEKVKAFEQIIKTKNLAFEHPTLSPEEKNVLLRSSVRKVETLFHGVDIRSIKQSKNIVNKHFQLGCEYMKKIDPEPVSPVADKPVKIVENKKKMTESDFEAKYKQKYLEHKAVVDKQLQDLKRENFELQKKIQQLEATVEGNRSINNATLEHVMEHGKKTIIEQYKKDQELIEKKEAEEKKKEAALKRKDKGVQAEAMYYKKNASTQVIIDKKDKEVQTNKIVCKDKSVDHTNNREEKLEQSLQINKLLLDEEKKKREEQEGLLKKCIEKREQLCKENKNYDNRMTELNEKLSNSQMINDEILKFTKDNSDLKDVNDELLKIVEKNSQIIQEERQKNCELLEELKRKDIDFREKVLNLHEITNKKVADAFNVAQNEYDNLQNNYNKLKKEYDDLKNENMFGIDDVLELSDTKVDYLKNLQLDEDKYQGINDLVSTYTKEEIHDLLTISHIDRMNEVNEFFYFENLKFDLNMEETGFDKYGFGGIYSSYENDSVVYYEEESGIYDDNF